MSTGDDDLLAEVDRDLQAACAARHDAWLVLVVKDSPANRDNFAKASAEVDDLLDLRHDVMAAEGMVTL